MTILRDPPVKLWPRVTEEQSGRVGPDKGGGAQLLGPDGSLVGWPNAKQPRGVWPSVRKRRADERVPA
ncbi:unnamed protein product [Protopolystoma xenopodis]|uniref:Uncharacterized protein n=1 Tax=Protopolystoma xenopodis TaxID=117903 RepID=A0A448X4K5_9PLAT|nr:unnamed protein product [Protopolystoma xenopodis]